jgi:hypothetical protein
MAFAARVPLARIAAPAISAAVAAVLAGASGQWRDCRVGSAAS